jgi:hypothetical protein
LQEKIKDLVLTIKKTLMVMLEKLLNLMMEHIQKWSIKVKDNILVLDQMQQEKID